VFLLVEVWEWDDDKNAWRKRRRVGVPKRWGKSEWSGMDWHGIEWMRMKQNGIESNANMKYLRQAARAASAISFVAVTSATLRAAARI